MKHSSAPVYGIESGCRTGCSDILKNAVVCSRYFPVTPDSIIARLVEIRSTLFKTFRLSSGLFSDTICLIQTEKMNDCRVFYFKLCFSNYVLLSGL